MEKPSTVPEEKMEKPSTGPDVPTVNVSRDITVERWETYMTSLSVRNVPIFAPHDPNSNSPPSPKFKVDLEIWVNYLPTTSDVFSANNVQTPASPTPPSSTAKNSYLTEFLRRLPVLESLAVCYLRHQFIQAWRTTVHDVHRECFDVYPLTLPSTRLGAGSKLFVDFLDWVQTYLSSRMLIKLPPPVGPSVPSKNETSESRDEEMATLKDDT